VLGETRECFFPAPAAELEATTFRQIAERYLEARGLTAHPCASEDEARARVEELAARGEWPCFFFRSDTTGEKPLEEFRAVDEEVDLGRFREIGVVRWPAPGSSEDLDHFLARVRALAAGGRWERADLLDALQELVPEFEHREAGRFLDNRM
jgi:hypothetical protein